MNEQVNIAVHEMAKLEHHDARAIVAATCAAIQIIRDSNVQQGSLIEQEIDARLDVLEMNGAVFSRKYAKNLTADILSAISMITNKIESGEQFAEHILSVIRQANDGGDTSDK